MKNQNCGGTELGIGKLLSLIVIILIACAVSTQAAVVKVQVEAEIAYFDGGAQYYFEGIELGDTLTMVYSYDTEAEVDIVEYTRAYTQVPPMSISASIKGYEFETQGVFGIFLTEQIGTV